MAHICVSKLINIGSDNGVSAGRHQVIIWNNAGILLVGPLETSLCKTIIEVHNISLKKMVKWRPFYLDLSVLKMELLEEGME